MYLEVYAQYMSSRSQRNYDHHHQSNWLMMEHRSSTGACHLTLNLAVTVALCHISLLIHCWVPPSVSGPPSLLWVPLKGCLSHMSIWSPQRVANPTLVFLSPLLPVTALLASTALLFRLYGATKI